MEKKKIVSIDDDSVVLTLVEKTLSNKGYEVVTASDGLEGIDKIRMVSPDIVLLDIMMPRVDGMEVLRILRASEQFNKLPVIMFTAISDDERVMEAARLGAVDYLVKPFKSAALIDKVENALKRNVSKQRQTYPDLNVASAESDDLEGARIDFESMHVVFLISGLSELIEEFERELDDSYRLRIFNPLSDELPDIRDQVPDSIIIDGTTTDRFGIKRLIRALTRSNNSKRTKYYLLPRESMSAHEIEEIMKMGIDDIIDFSKGNMNKAERLNEVLGINLVELRKDGEAAVLRRKDFNNQMAGKEIYHRIVNLSEEGVKKIIVDISNLKNIGETELHHLSRTVDLQWKLGIEILFVVSTDAVERSLREASPSPEIVIQRSVEKARQSLYSAQRKMITENGSDGISETEIITTPND